jgi:hypothetical protein
LTQDLWAMDSKYPHDYYSAHFDHAHASNKCSS